MQLKIKRSQRMGGVMSNNTVFCLDARVQFTAEEQQNIARYKLGAQVIYNSDASKRLLEKGKAQQDGSALGSLKSLATVALAAMRLNISINSLAQGQHIECKSLDELLAAESALMQACENLKSYLDAAATFDGREVLFDFSTGSPQAVASAVTPQPMLVIEPKQIAAPSAWVGIAEVEAPKPGRYDEPRDYRAEDDAYEPMPSIFEQLKTAFLWVPVPARMFAGTVLLYILIIKW
jgi:hypothetical protein